MPPPYEAYTTKLVFYHAMIFYYFFSGILAIACSAVEDDLLTKSSTYSTLYDTTRLFVLRLFVLFVFIGSVRINIS